MTSPEVLQLLELYKADQEKVREPKIKKKCVWEEISKKMQEENYPYSALKCEVKFKNLKQKYVRTVDHNNQSEKKSKNMFFFQ